MSEYSPHIPQTVIHRLPTINHKRIYLEDHRHLLLYDGADALRDITSCSADLGKEKELLLVSIGLRSINPERLDLLDLGILIGISSSNGKERTHPVERPRIRSRPWNIQLLYDGNRDQVFCFQRSGKSTKLIREGVSIYILPQGNEVLAMLDKSVLLAAGWDKSKNITIQAYTSQPNTDFITDSLDDWEHKKRYKLALLKSARRRLSVPNHTLDAYYDISKRRIQNYDNEQIGSPRLPVQGSGYYIVTDRFHRSGVLPDHKDLNSHDPRAFHGGDIQGIIEKLDEGYFDDLGLSFLVISPVMRNSSVSNPQVGVPYHYYHVHDLEQVDPRQGSLEDICLLIRKAHKKGLKVLLDIPLNHGGYYHPWETDPQKKDWFRKGEPGWEFFDDSTVKDLISRPLFGLPSYDHTNREVADYLIQTAIQWLKKTDADGFRLDAARHVYPPFWQKLAMTISDEIEKPIILMAEIINTNQSITAQYQRYDLGIIDYPFYHLLIETLHHERSMIEFAHTIRDQRYEDPSSVYSFLDSQDTTRIASRFYGNYFKIGMALTFLFTMNRNTLLLYGTEIKLKGRVTHTDDSGVRGDMVFQSPDERYTMFFKLLSFLRHTQPVLSGGNLQILSAHQNFLAYMRRHPDMPEEFVIAANNQTHQIHMSFEIPSRYDSDEEWIDIFLGKSLHLRDGNLEKNFHAYESCLFVPVRLLKSIFPHDEWKLS